MTIPLPSPFVGDPDTQQNLDALAGQFPLGPHQTHHQIYPQARVYRSTDFSHNSSGNWLTITFDTERWDYYPDGYTEQHSVSSNTSRLTCRVGGLYQIGCNAEWDYNTAGARYLRLLLNAATAIGVVGTSGDATLVQHVNVQFRLSPGDYVEVQAWQNSGGTRTLLAGINIPPEFWFGWLSP